MRKDIFPDPGLISEGEEWYKNRSAVQQDMMRVKSAMHYLHDIEQIAVELRNVFGVMRDSNSCVNVNQLLKLWALESIACIFLCTRLQMFSDDPAKNVVGKEMISAVAISFEEMVKLLFMPPIWKYFPNLIPSYRRFDKASETLAKLSKECVDTALDQLDLDNDSEQSILAKLARRNGKDSPICHIMAMDALVAGIDTTGNTAILLLYHLATNPAKQETLYKEIVDTIGAGKDDLITESGLNKVRYLKACLQESQRMLPVVAGTSRITNVDMVLSGYQVPKGTFVFRVGQVTSNSPQSFEKPKQFLPERWIRDCPQYDKEVHPFSNLPFGHGPRSCVGKRFAHLELYVLVIKLLQKYRLEYHGEAVDVLTDLVSRPDRDVKIQFEER